MESRKYWEKKSVKFGGNVQDFYMQFGPFFYSTAQKQASALTRFKRVSEKFANACAFT